MRAPASASATSYGIVERPGGNIGFDTEAGAGATFRVFLPSVQPAEPGRRRCCRDRRREGGTSRCCSSRMRRAAFGWRGGAVGPGYQVLAARDGHEAMRVAANGREAIRLLLTDVVMPGMGGRELAERLLTERPRLRVLFSSGYPSDAVAEDGSLAEGIEFLQKPYEPAVLAGRVREDPAFDGCARISARARRRGSRRRTRPRRSRSA